MLTTGTGGCISWPEADLSSFPCGPAITAEVKAVWEPVATLQLFRDTGRRFPGTSCTFKGRVCDGWAAYSACYGESCDLRRLDLSEFCPYPVLGIAAVLDGTPSDWEIENQRYLKPTSDDVEWPTSWEDSPTWEFSFGRMPPPDVLKARDQVLHQMIMANSPPSGHHVEYGDGGEVSFTENGRTYTVNPTAVNVSFLHEKVKHDYRRRVGDQSNIYDPAAASDRPLFEVVV